MSICSLAIGKLMGRNILGVSTEEVTSYAVVELLLRRSGCFYFNCARMSPKVLVSFIFHCVECLSVFFTEQRLSISIWKQ